MLVNYETNNRQGPTQVTLDELDHDFQRVLKVQFKEFIHHIEDCEDMTRSIEEGNVSSLKRSAQDKTGLGTRRCSVA